MIDFLIKSNELYDAERYARISYECLSRPESDQNNDMVANVSHALASVTLQLLKQGSKAKDIGNKVECEMLAKKALRCVSNDRAYSGAGFVLTPNRHACTQAVWSFSY